MAKCIRCGKKSMMLKVSPEGLCMDCLQQELNAARTNLDEIKSKMTPEENEIISTVERLQQVRAESAAEQDRLSRQLSDLNMQCGQTAAQIDRNQETLSQLSAIITDKQRQIAALDETLAMQDFGIFTPKYPFTTSDEYKARLDAIRKQQTAMVKGGIAVTGSQQWTVNGSAAEGKKMISEMQKLLLRAFNSECDYIIANVKYSNYPVCHRRIDASATSISKLGARMQIAITQGYYDLKLQELDLAFEYQQKKQEEKEELKEKRAQMREEAKAQKELEAARQKSEKEQSHYQNALAALQKQIEQKGETAELLEKKAEIEARLSTIEADLQQLDYREANARAGYVYVISNIGSFGENVYKIGMTRRLDPMERVDELGDASVPFDFDVHAMIFSDDAPKLEAALHNAFEDRKVNMVNTRREFFRVTLDEIKAVVKANYDKTAEFIEFPEAEQFRESEQMRKQQ